MFLGSEIESTCKLIIGNFMGPVCFYEVPTEFLVLIHVEKRSEIYIAERGV